MARNEEVDKEGGRSIEQYAASTISDNFSIKKANSPSHRPCVPIETCSKALRQRRKVPRGGEGTEKCFLTQGNKKKRGGKERMERSQLVEDDTKGGNGQKS